MTFAQFRKVGWDLETTGPNPHTARVVTSAIVVRGGGNPDCTFSYLINPGVPIPPAAAAVHGIDDTRAQAEGVAPRAALEDVANKLTAALLWGMPVVAFNLSYDWTVLDCDLARHGLPSMTDRLGSADGLPLVDPHVIDKAVIQRRAGAGMRKLKPTAGVYGVQLEDWHTAEADALAGLLIAEAQFVRFPELEEYGPAGLFAAQRKWRAQQQESLRDYFARTPGKEHQAATVRTEWPLIPQEEVAADAV